MEDKNDAQDVDLENNEGETTEEDSTEEPTVEEPQKSDREVELEAEVSKYKRLLAKKDKAETKKPTVQEEPSQPSDLDYGERAYLRSALDIKGSDELQLAKEWKAKYDMTVDEMESDEVFLNRLSTLRQAKQSAAALPKAGKRTGQPADADLDTAVAKFNETGELPADFELRNKVIDKAIVKPKTGVTF